MDIPKHYVNGMKMIQGGILAEVRSLSSQCRFPEALEAMQAIIHRGVGGIEIRLLLSQIYVCLKCPYQAYYNLASLYMPTGANPKPPVEVDKLLARVSCEIARFDTARNVVSVLRDPELLTFVEKKEEAFKRTVDEQVATMGSHVRNILMDGIGIECKIPHTPNNKRKAEEVLSAINGKLSSSDIELKRFGDECYGLFAKKDFEAGQIIWKEVPYAAVNGDTINRCFHCCRSITTRVKCCSVVYCSEACRDIAKNEYHEPLCGLNTDSLFNVVRNGRSSTSRLPLLCWKILGKSLISAGEGRLTSYPSRYNGLSLLYRHSMKEDYMMPCTGVRLYDTFRSMLVGTKYESEPYLGVEWLIDCNEMLLLNTLNAGSDSDPLKQNQVILLIGSFFNHSEEPNCEWFGDVEVSFRTTRKIKEGEQIFISYSRDHNTLKYVYKV